MHFEISKIKIIIKTKATTQKKIDDKEIVEKKTAMAAITPQKAALTKIEGKEGRIPTGEFAKWTSAKYKQWTS